MQTDTELLLEALSQPPSAILLWLGHRLRRRFAGRAVVEVADTYLLRLEEYAADGHAEVHKWVDPRTRPPVRYNNQLQLNVASPNNQDMIWLSERTSSLTKP